jgi:cytochrome P450
MYSVLIPLAWAIVFAVVILVYQKVLQYVAFSAKRRQTGCFKAPVYPHSDILGGSDLVKQRQQAQKDGNLQALYTRHFNALGKTWEETFWNERVINTMDAVNHQYIHALGFEEFGKPNQRMKISAPILGNGIFVAEGAHWKHSRSIIKPIFARAELENMELMAKHVNRFIHLLPRDSKTFDIQSMLKRMVSRFSLTHE